MEPKLETQMEFDFMNNQDKNKFGIKQMLGLVTSAVIGTAVGATLSKFDGQPENVMDSYFITILGAWTSVAYLTYLTNKSLSFPNN